MIYEKKSNEQLFTLVNRLSVFVPNDYVIGTVLGYSIIHSLSSFRTEKVALDQKRFDEIKKVYEGLDVLISSYAKGFGSKLADDMQNSVDNFFEILKSEYGGNGVLGLGSSIVERVMLGKIKRKTKNFGDAMMKSGIEIKDNICRIGVFSRPIDYLNSDYEVLEQSFGIGGK